MQRVVCISLVLGLSWQLVDGLRCTVPAGQHVKPGVVSWWAGHKVYVSHLQIICGPDCVCADRAVCWWSGSTLL
jgi:hypothetical protein